MGFSFFKKKTSPEAVNPKKTALVLGGGGTRGFAHVGAMKAFEEHGVSFDFCVGTSVGSLMGALYAANVKTSELLPFCDELDLRDVHSRFLLFPDSPSKIGKIVTRFLGDAEIKDLHKPFYAVAVDLVTAKEVVIDDGKVADAVSASCCVPLLFKPFVRGKQHLVDGGLLNNIPAETAKMLGAEKVVAVDINATRGGGTEKLGMFDVAKATFRIMSANASVSGIRQADVLIRVDTDKFSSSKKDGYEEMINLGYRAALEKMTEIKELLYGKKGK